ncbi:MAG: adenylate cyclase [Bacteroidetes bacterium 4572_117]|nr:MAG: adenylate cyclase [Bacteroidetes bacterium 4572_117]
MKRTNIEIKARCDDHEMVKKILLSGNAEFKGVDHQIDSYFKVNSGRLKLREGNIENALIHYNREDKDDPKESDILLYKTSKNSLLKDLLSKALGKLITIDKEREIYFIDNVKFHLDKVKGLGKFIEIEAIGKDSGDKSALLQQCKFYLNLFNISKENLIPVSYSDMLLEKQSN